MQEFNISEEVTVIQLGSTSIDVKWFEGYWSQDPGYDPYPDVSLKILDEKTCAYFIGIYNRETDLPDDKYKISSYIFDPVARTLIIEDAFGYEGGIMLIAKDKTEDDYGADRIKIRKGEGYEFMAMDDIIRMK